MNDEDDEANGSARTFVLPVLAGCASGVLAQRERALFGDPSEKRPRPEGLHAATTTPTPQTSHGPTSQPTLPRIETRHTLPEDERTCPQCGGTLTEWPGQTEGAEEITVVE